MIELSQLEVTHNHLRNHAVLPEMVRHVSEGGLWDRKSLEIYACKDSRHIGRVAPLIQITRFEDGRLFVHDGHHRSVSVFLAGRMHLHDSEYVMTDWKYKDYLEISHPNGWYTPFDPRIQCRAPSFSKFKSLAKQRFIESDPCVFDWIMENTSIFCEPREIHTVEELASRVKLEKDHCHV